MPMPEVIRFTYSPASREIGADDWGRVFRGRDRIREWSDAEFIGQQVSLDVTGVRSEGAATVVSAQVGGDGFNGPSDFAFEVSGDKVALMKKRLN